MNKEWIAVLVGLLIIGVPIFWILSVFEAPWWTYTLVALIIMGGMMSEKL